MVNEYIPLEDAPVYGGQPVRIEDIMESLTRNHPDADVTLVQRAYIYAASAHQGMVRRSGEPYLNHPLAVAGILCDMKLDVASVAAGLLHDTIEDNPDVTYDDIAKKFGKDVANIVDGVTKIGQMNFSSATERKATNMRKMILAMLTDLRVILVKLADRLNNMRTLGFMPERKQQIIASETLEIFAPLASRLGIHKIQTELEDLSLFYLEPADYSSIRLNLSAGRSDRQQYVEEVIAYLTKRIQEFKIKAQIEGRPKHIYSIWKKMRDQNLTFDQLYDLTAFRIIVDTIQDCYSALGVIHSVFKAIPGRFKDYINLPKANGYQSLHTAVIGPRNTRMEIQIRTLDMHNYAENGVAAHWRYKDGGAVSSEENQRITALRSILSWQENLDNPDAFLNSVRESLAEHESIYVFTPAGDVKELPAGACPVDFAYAIHTMVGHNCVGAKVNGGIVPLRHKLQNGDTVEVMTNRNGAPSRDWLNYAVSPRAKARIRQWFAAEERAKAVDFGHDLLEKEMRKAGIPKAKLANPELLKSLGFASLDELNAAVAFGKVPFKRIMQILAPDKFKAPSSAPLEIKAPAGREGQGGPDLSKSVLVSGQSDIFVKLAKCCSPIPGEPIIGYITQGHGVSIHSATCSSLAGLDSDRLISVSWSDHQDSLFEVYLNVRATNISGILLRVLNVVTPLVENIIEAHAADDADGGGMSFRLSVKNQAQFDAVLKALKEIPAVKRAERVFPEKS